MRELERIDLFAQTVENVVNNKTNLSTVQKTTWSSGQQRNSLPPDLRINLETIPLSPNNFL